MTRSLALVTIIALSAVCLCARAEATTLSVFTNDASFIAATGATNATGPLPDIGGISSGSQAVGNITFTTDSGGLFIGTANLGLGCGGVIGCDWTARHPGADIAISGVENFHADVTLGGPVYSLGFYFVKPINDPSYVSNPGPSTFTVSLFSGATFVGSFAYSTPSADVPADTLDFIGGWSTDAFDRARIVETIGGIDDEYWGEFYTGTRANPVPEPTACVLLGTGLAAGFFKRRSSR